MLNKPFDWYLEWSSTTCLILGSILTSLNVYPLNLVFSFAGNLGWLIAGMRMQKPSLWVVSAFLLIVYLGGIVLNWFNG